MLMLLIRLQGMYAVGNSSMHLRTVVFPLWSFLKKPPRVSNPFFCDQHSSVHVNVQPHVCMPQAPSPMTFDALLKTCCSLQADSIALLLSNDKYDTDDPIVEAAVSNLALELSGQPLAQQLASSCAMTLHVDVYNNGMMGWESLVEPWASCVTLAIPLTR